MLSFEFLKIVTVETIVETLYLTGMIMLIGLLLGILRTNSIKNFQRSFGFKAVMITGFIGVPLHEISHALFCIIFRHPITKMKLIQEPDENGTMGYVEHSYNPNSAYQQIGNFFIGVAPIFGGVISIIVLMKLMLPVTYNEFIKISINNLQITTLNKEIVEGILGSYYGLVKTIFALSNFKNPYFYLFLFISICISSHISLSSADIKGASKGLAVLFLLVFILNILGISKYISMFDVFKYNLVITGFLIVALLFSTMTFIVGQVCVLLKQK